MGIDDPYQSPVVLRLEGLSEPERDEVRRRTVALAGVLIAAAATPALARRAWTLFGAVRELAGSYDAAPVLVPAEVVRAATQMDPPAVALLYQVGQFRDVYNGAGQILTEACWPSGAAQAIARDGAGCYGAATGAPQSGLAARDGTEAGRLDADDDAAWGGRS